MVRSLHPLNIADVMQWFEDRTDLEVLWAGPRYWPTWARTIVRVPGVREVVTWNLVVIFRRHEDAAPATGELPKGLATGSGSNRR